jgi:hypothetical protein
MYWLLVGMSIVDGLLGLWIKWNDSASVVGNALMCQWAVFLTASVIVNRLDDLRDAIDDLYDDEETEE